MKPYTLVAVALLASVGLVFAWRTRSLPGPGPRLSAPSASPVPLSAPPVPEPTPPRLSRNPFEYVEPQPVRLRPDAVVRVPSPLPSPLTDVVAPVKLVGFLRRGSALRAILSIRGEVLLLAVGEEGGGYTLVSADEERGALLKGADGSDIALALPSPSGS
jgi:hypothetical protein